jgi:hypothetical protein
MSRIEELENEIKGLENRRLELLKQLEVEKQKFEIEYPFEDEGQYWFVGSTGDICFSWWYQDGIDTARFEMGNAFKTKEEAEKELDRRILLTKFRQFRDKCNGDWKPTINEKKYYIFFNFEEQKFKIDWFCQIGIFELFGTFKNEADAERAVELFGDEIIRLWVDE